MSGDDIPPDGASGRTDPSLRELREAALKDLREDGLDEDSLREITSLWRRQDEILGQVRAANETGKVPSNPLQRARVNIEVAERKAVEARHTWREFQDAAETLRDLRHQAADLLNRFGSVDRFLFMHRFLVEGTVSDTLGGEIWASVSARTVLPRLRFQDHFTVQIQGLNESFEIGWLQAVVKKWDPTAVNVRRRATPEEVRTYADVVMELRVQKEIGAHP